MTDRFDDIDFSTAQKRQSGGMSAFLLGLFRLIWLLRSGHQAVVLENLDLRQQLAVYKRKKKRPQLIRCDRWFWVALAGLWQGWRRALIVVHPDTVVRWQRQRFRRYWARISTRPRKLGRPQITRQTRKLIRTMARMNSLWRAPRLHGELLKPGIRFEVFCHWFDYQHHSMLVDLSEEPLIRESD